MQQTQFSFWPMACSPKLMLKHMVLMGAHQALIMVYAKLTLVYMGL